MKKVLVLANGTLSLYKFRKEILCELVSENFEVVVASPNDGFIEELKQVGVRYLDVSMNRRGTNPIQDIFLLSQYFTIMQREKPNLILGYTIKPNIYGNMVARLFGIPIISNITGLGDAFLAKGLMPSFVRLLYKLGFSKHTWVAFQNQNDREVMLRLELIPLSRCFTLNGSGVNLSEFKPIPYPNHGKVIFLYVGRIMKTKGVDELLEAAEKLKGLYGDLVEIRLAGYFDGNYEERITQGQKRGLITYIGFLNNVREAVAESSCIVLPSYQEGMSNALLEAAAMARPLIATNIPGCKEIIKDGKNGFFCKPRDAESLYNAMKKFMKLSNDARQEMAHNSHSLVKQTFDRTKVVELMMQHINEILS